MQSSCQGIVTQPLSECQRASIPPPTRGKGPPPFGVVSGWVYLVSLFGTARVLQPNWIMKPKIVLNTWKAEDCAVTNCPNCGAMFAALKKDYPNEPAARQHLHALLIK